MVRCRQREFFGSSCATRVQIATARAHHSSVTSYLNILRAQDRLDTTKAEITAVKRQLEQVQQRFDVGLVAITDVLDSQAAYDNAVVRGIQAEGDYAILFEDTQHTDW